MGEKRGKKHVNKKFIDNITDFLFISDTPVQSDIIFIPGSNQPELAESAAYLYKNGFAPCILPSGKYSKMKGHFIGPAIKKDIYHDDYKTEADFLTDVLVKNGVPKHVILPERWAENTYENAVFSKQIVDNQGLSVKKAILCCQAFHSRRCLMYYQLFFPDTTFYVFPTDTKGINRNNWYKTERDIDVVLGEFERCANQFTGIIKTALEETTDQEK